MTLGAESDDVENWLPCSTVSARQATLVGTLAGSEAGPIQVSMLLKLFSSSLTVRQIKLECLSVASCSN